MYLNYEERPEFVLRAEIEELKTVERTQYKPIIIKMAAKLEGLDYIENTKISSYLSKVLKSHVTDRYIQKILPDKFKQEHKAKTELVRTLDSLDEFILQYKEAFNLGLKFLDDLQRKAKESNELRAELMTSTPFTELVRSARDMIIDFSYMAELTDYREKLTMFNKVIMKMDMFHFSLHKVANNVHQTAKWAKAIDRDPKLKSYIERLEKCPRCDWNMRDWFDKNIIRLNKGLVVKFPTKVELNKDA